MAYLCVALASMLAVSAMAGIIPEHHEIPVHDISAHDIQIPHEISHQLPLHHEVPAHAYHHAIPHGIPIPPAISTVSFVSLNPHHPTSYSGFTNHGRGHHDPGYGVQFRQDGYALPHAHAYHHEHDLY